MKVMQSKMHFISEIAVEQGTCPGGKCISSSSKTTMTHRHWCLPETVNDLLFDPRHKMRIGTSATPRMDKKRCSLRHGRLIKTFY